VGGRLSCSFRERRGIAVFFILAMLVASPNICDSAVQQDMNRCALDRANRADQLLADELQASRSWGAENAGDGKGRPGGATSDGDSYANVLENAERTWLIYRDAQCRLAVYRYHGGSMAPMVEFGCRADLTEARIAQLKALRD
jgi:uncharacterized protein YecT (DUF1311 family)